MNIVFLMTAKFPTNKAYGVTTTGTLKGLAQLGHNVEVFSSSQIEAHYKSTLLLKIVSKSNNIYGNLKNKSLYFRLLRLMVFVAARKKYVKSIDLLWIREIPLALITLLFMQKQWIVLEIHQKPQRLNKLILSLLIRQRRVIVCPIKSKLISGIRAGRYAPVIAPMSVTEDFLTFGRSRTSDENGEFNKILYLGNISNQHQEKCVRYFLKNIEQFTDDNRIKTITIIGIPMEWIWNNSSERLKSSNKIKILHHVQHSEIPKYIEPGMIGVLSYFDTDYFKNTFPIKTVEYAALKIPIIASSTEANHDILPENCAYFFDMSEATYNLSKCLNVVVGDSINVNKTVHDAFKWVEKFSYRKRAERVMEELSQRQCGK